MRGWLARLLVASYMNPRQAARDVLRLPLSNTDMVGLVVLAAILLTLGIWLLEMVAGVESDPFQEFVKSQPLLIAAIQLVSIPVGASISMAIARLFGGRGSFRNSIIVIVWLNGAMAILQIALLLIVPVVPPLAAPLFFLALVWFLIAYASGMAEVHGFRNIYLVIAAMLALFVLFIVLVNYLALKAGFVPAGMG